MRIITWYVVQEFLKVFLITLTGTTAVCLLSFVALEAKREGIGLAQTLQIMPYLLPEALRFAVPATTLFAACSVYGRLSASNEVIAIKSLGISPMVLVTPVLVIGAALSFASVELNNLAVTWGRAGVRRVVIESVEQIIYNMLRVHRSYATGGIAMNVRRVQDRTLIKPTVTIGRGGGKTITINAEEADMHSDLDRGTLTIRFFDAVIDYGSGGVNWPGSYEHEIDLVELCQRSEGSLSPSACPMDRIDSEIEQQEENIRQIKQHVAATAAMHMMTGNFERLADSTFLTNRRRVEGARRMWHRLHTEPWRRWANGFSCLCFLVVGVPLAILRRKGEFLTSFAFCFFPILIGYYPLLLFAVDQAKSGAWPPQSVWLGNAVAVLVGMVLMGRARRF